MNRTECMLAAARECLGVPFHHQGRNPKTGLDCIGLIVCALRAAGVVVRDRADYSRQPQEKELIAALLAHDFVPAEEIASGDVLIFRFNRQAQHAGLAVSASRLIHAYAPAGRVVETGLGISWRRRLSGIYRLKD